MAGMQRKTIAAAINMNVDRWVWSIKDEERIIKYIDTHPILPDSLDCLAAYKKGDEADKKIVLGKLHDRIKHGVLVTGGAIASMLLGEEVNDYDLYFSDLEVGKFVCWYYLFGIDWGDNGKVPKISLRENNTGGIHIFIKSMGVVGDEEEEHQTESYQYFESVAQNEADAFFKEKFANEARNKEDRSHSVQFMTSNAISLHSGIQLITRFVGDASEIHKNFDFVHATNYWTADGGLVLNDKALTALLERRLYYVGSKFPITSIFRIRKFLKRDFRISAGEIVKIAYDISKLNLENVSVLQDQMLGCDNAYFHEVIEMLRNGEKEGRSFDRAYLIQCIDNVFSED